MEIDEIIRASSPKGTWIDIILSDKNEDLNYYSIEPKDFVITETFCYITFPNGYIFLPRGRIIRIDTTFPESEEEEESESDDDAIECT